MFSGSDFLGIPWRAPRARRARVLGSKVSPLAVSRQEPHPRGTGWPGMARDGGCWGVVMLQDHFVPGRLYDICPRTEIFCTKKHTIYKNISASPSVVLKPNSCCGTNNFLTKKKNIRIRKILFKIDARAPKIWYGPQREIYPLALEVPFWRGVSVFDPFHAMVPGYAARTCCPGANSAGRPQPCPSFCRCIPPRGAPFTGPAEVAVPLSSPVTALCCSPANSKPLWVVWLRRNISWHFLTNMCHEFSGSVRSETHAPGGHQRRGWHGRRFWFLRPRSRFHCWGGLHRNWQNPEPAEWSESAAGISSWIVPSTRESSSRSQSLTLFLDIFCLTIHGLWCISFLHHQGQFRSQTFDNMDRWKSRGGKSQRGEEEKREDQRRERVRRKKMQVREKVGKLRNTLFFPLICGSGGSKSRLAKVAKAAGAEPSGQMRDERSRCGAEQIILFASEKAKTPHVRNTFGSWAVEKSERRRGAKHISMSKCAKHTILGALLEVEMSKKCTSLWREAHVQVKMLQTLHAQRLGPLLKVQMWFWRGRRKGCCTLPRGSAPCQLAGKREGFVAFPKTMAGVGHLKRIYKDAFSVAGAVQETSSSELLGGEGADFLRGVAFWSIRSSGLLALRMTWHHFFVAGAVLSTGGLLDWKNRKTHWYEAVSSALSFPFLKEVSQTCFAFDVVELKHWRHLGELLRFRCCEVKTLRKACRIAAFSMLSCLESEQVSQNCFVFDGVSITLPHVTGTCKQKFGESMSWNCWCNRWCTGGQTCQSTWL